MLKKNLNTEKDTAIMGFYSRFLSIFMVFSKVQKDQFVLTPRPFSSNPSLVGSIKRQSSIPTVRARPLRSSSLFRTAPVADSLSLLGGYTSFPPNSKHSFSYYPLMVFSLLALLPLLCHVVLKTVWQSWQLPACVSFSLSVSPPKWNVAFDRIINGLPGDI